jgi:hypothetical protein
MPVEILSTIYLFICQVLWIPPYIETTIAICYIKFSICFGYLPCVICRLSYAKARMSVYICWVPYASEFTIISIYMPISVPVYACFMLKLAYQLQYIYIYMSAHECLILPMSCQVSLYANLGCFVSNCYISVYMPSALFHMLYAKCYELYAKLRMLDCNMSNAITIAISFSMTTEQVGHLIIYIYLLFGYDSPYCRYREEITIIPPWLQFIYQVSGISICQHIRLLCNILSHVYFSMPTYHGMSKSFSMPAYHGIDQNPQSPFMSVRQHIKASINNSYRYLFWYANISRHSIIPSVIANSGSVIYRDSDLKANKYHIFYYIRSHRVSRFGILT